MKPGTKTATKVGDGDQRMGSALRSVYQKTVDEAVPDEMLALLGKLD
ncbi:NepR family anti-sigma factor [Sphingomonas ginsenosidivorax]|nr:NepR family anti-sigma factor [Sphingomonas ginsenosidivorax]